MLPKNRADLFLVLVVEQRFNTQPADDFWLHRSNAIIERYDFRCKSLQSKAARSVYAGPFTLNSESRLTRCFRIGYCPAWLFAVLAHMKSLLGGMISHANALVLWGCVLKLYDPEETWMLPGQRTA